MANSYNVRLAGIETYSTSLSPKPKDFSGVSFNFDLGAEHKVNAEKSIIMIRIIVDIRDEDKPNVLGHCSVIYLFELDNFKEIVLYNEKENTFTIPQDLETQLRNLSLSTTRGIVYSTFKGTYLQGATLPIIGNIKQFQGKTEIGSK